MKNRMLIGVFLAALMPISAYSKDLCLQAISSGNPDIFLKYKGVKSLKKIGAIVELHGIILYEGDLPLTTAETAAVLGNGAITFMMMGSRVTGADENLAGGQWEDDSSYSFQSIDCKTFPAY